MKEVLFNDETRYIVPRIESMDILVERGFGESSSVDEMFENEGNWN